MKCKNNCIITGEIENLKKLDVKLNNRFDMQDIVPVANPSDDVLTLMTWGAAKEMELQAYMFSDFAPEHIFYAYMTEGPNEMFWRHVSRIFGLEVNYSFYNKETGYIGLYKYKNGDLIDYEYEEDEESQEYIDLLNKCKDNFLDVDDEDNTEDSESKELKIISINDLRRK